MEASTIWWILAGITIAAELLTGGIYLLMISTGLAAGAIAAQLGLGLPAQISMAAIIGVWHRVPEDLRPWYPQVPPSAPTRLQLLY